MKFFIFTMIIFTYLGCSSKLPPMEDKKYEPMSFNEVWSEVESDEVKVYPQKKVSFFKLHNKKGSVIAKDSQRTLSDTRDIIEPFEKLAHPNGICLKGVWEIDTPNIYGGYFKKGSKALIIARASTAMGNTKRGEKRSFGFAGKLFASLDSTQINTQKSANFFLIDDLGGTDSKAYTDVSMTNEPKVSFTFEVLKNIAYGANVTRTFARADKNPGMRQLYEISYLGESKSEHSITPKWMRLEALTKREAKDFRDELKIKAGEKLIFSVSVANKKVKGKRDFQEIGKISFDSSVVSKTCDRRLHFHHPRWRDDLDYGI